MSLFPSILQLGVAAVLLIIMPTIFLSRAAKGRRVAGRASDHQETNRADSSLEETESSTPDHEETNRGSPSLNEETQPSNPGEDVGVPDLHRFLMPLYGADCRIKQAIGQIAQEDVGEPDIFLCHSGRQKLFVNQLYEYLRWVDFPTYLHVHTFSKRFCPFQIEQAARGCKIGIVVLSEEFLISKWPMIELKMLILQKGPKPCVLPLFYGLNPGDLESPEKLLKWRCVWKEMGGENSAKHWEEAVKSLKDFNGEVFVQGTSTDAYINKVVQRIFTMIPCHVSYDCSSIKGQSRLVKEIATKFENVDPSQACMVGLHGVGGLGKTTLCKVMVNHSKSHYLGRSALIEFPSLGGGADSSLIIWECKKAFNKLVYGIEHSLNRVEDFDEVVQLLRDCVGRHEVFLAIDNVSESSLKEAMRVLQLGFHANSKILVTSRSEQVIKDLLMVRRHGINASVAPLPAPEREEAIQIFQETLVDISALVDSNQMDRVLEKCWFDGSYHALALKALAKYVKRVCMSVDSEEIKHHLSSVLEEISLKDLSDVEKVIRLSYDNRSQQKKSMFLDIVVSLVVEGAPTCTVAKAQEWISFLYWEFSGSKITRLINELASDGLIQIEVDKYGTTEIGVHDLYLELARREIGSSPRFLIEDLTESLEKIEWEDLEIAILNGDEPDPWLFEKLQQCKCPKLKLLRACDRVIKSGNWLYCMPSLSVLELEDLTESDSDSGSEKENVAQSHLLQPLEHVPGMPSLDQEGTVKNSSGTGFVRREGLGDASRILHLNGLVNLRKLKVKKCSFVEAIAGLDALGNLKMLTVDSCERLKSLDGLSGLVQLQVLQVFDCGSLQRLPDVSSSTCLERLEMCDNDAMEEVGGLSCALKTVIVRACGVLKRMPDMSSLTCLETLDLGDNKSMEEVGGEYLSSTLKHFDTTRCGSLRSCPSLDECMHLETLATGCAHHISSLPKLTNLHTCLRRLTINEDGLSTIEKIDVGCFTNLKDLVVRDCGELEEIVGDLSALHSLRSLTLWGCPSLKKLNVGCPSLKRLEVSHCKALAEIIGDVKAPPSLEGLDIRRCQSLNKLEGIFSIPLQVLHVEDCRSLPKASIPEAILPKDQARCTYL